LRVAKLLDLSELRHKLFPLILFLAIWLFSMVVLVMFPPTFEELKTLFVLKLCRLFTFAEINPLFAACLFCVMYFPVFPKFSFYFFNLLWRNWELEFMLPWLLVLVILFIIEIFTLLWEAETIPLDWPLSWNFLPSLSGSEITWFR